MDEDFFDNPNIDEILDLLKKYRVVWSCMSTAIRTYKIVERLGEQELADSGLVLVECGLENVALANKVKRFQKISAFVVYYLNICCLPGETKKTIQQNAQWFLDNEASIPDPIHHNNGLWYAPGQFYYPYDNHVDGGAWCDGMKARTRPTWVPDSLLDEELEVIDMGKVNFYCQLMYDFKLFPDTISFTMRDFCTKTTGKLDLKKVMWCIAGIRCGGII